MGCGRATLHRRRRPCRGPGWRTLRRVESANVTSERSSTTVCPGARCGSTALWRSSRPAMSISPRRAMTAMRLTSTSMWPATAPDPTVKRGVPATQRTRRTCRRRPLRGRPTQLPRRARSEARDPLLTSGSRRTGSVGDGSHTAPLTPCSTSSSSTTKGSRTCCTALVATSEIIKRTSRIKSASYPHRSKSPVTKSRASAGPFELTASRSTSTRHRTPDTAPRMTCSRWSCPS